MPPLEIQNEIVLILDNFTELEAELEAEQEARTQQYEYYRNKLLDFSTGFVGVPKIDTALVNFCPNGIEYVKLEEAVELVMGTSPKGNTITDDNSGFEFHQGKSHFTNFIVANSNKYTTEPIKIAQANSVIMSVRAPVGDCNITDRDIAIGRGLCSFKAKTNYSNKFFYYWLQSNIKHIKSLSSGSTFEAINTGDIKSLLIPSIPISIQNDIVKILDSFSELVTSISEGLPAEIKARKQQYEYYRNKILTFQTA
jgi:type I restriction enzyme S subunit